MPYVPPSRSVSKNTTNDVPSDSNSSASSSRHGGVLQAPALNISASTGASTNANSNANSSANASANDSRTKLDTSLRQDAFHNFMNLQNASFTNSINSSFSSNHQHSTKQSKFYLMDNASSTDSIESTAASGSASGAASRNGSAASLMINKIKQNLTLSSLPGENDNENDNDNTNDVDDSGGRSSKVEDLLKFTTESTQSYSYTPVSSSSLTMRLNVLKRSLEILLETPEWLSSSLESFPDYNTHIDHIYNADSNANANSNANGTTTAHHKHDISRLKDFLKMQKNISSSTLQTLLQSAITNDSIETPSSSTPSSSPTEISPLSTAKEHMPPPASNRLESRSNSINSNLTVSSFNDNIITELHEMLQLLEDYEQSDTQITTDIEDKFINLHNLSLSNDSNYSRDKRRNLLKIKLLHALATPFIEQTPSQTIDSLPMIHATTSDIGLSTLSATGMNNNIHGNGNGNGKPLQYHASSNAKTKSPKAVFTVSLDSPWDILNANDLGLLMFGFSKKSLQKMRLMDLIAPRSRDLVLDRLYRTNALVFSGEIIAVKRENNSLAWTSLWAKRKDKFIILIFEQIACETIDFVIEKKLGLGSEFYVTEILKQNKSLYKTCLANRKLSDFLPSLSAVLLNSETDDEGNPESKVTSLDDSNVINRLRYFTLKLENQFFIPCAITSEYLNIDEKMNDVKSLIRVNLHSIPYMAGTFVVSSKTYQIQSFNEAIARNMFGTGDLKNQPFDTIFPNFSKLIELALIENPNMNHQEGLVLPEHYFRKLSAQCKCTKDEDKDEVFLRCKGIDARHNDGNTVKVDIQLHVSSDQLYVIWVTFSRFLSKGIQKIQEDTGDVVEPGTEDNDELETVKSNIRFDDNIDVHHFNDERRESTDLPSQLHLLEHHHLDTDSYGSGSAGTNLSRSSSVKTVNQSSMSSPTTPKVDAIKGLTKIDSLASISPINAPVMEHEVDDNAKNTKSNLFHMTTMMTCKEHLLQEESHLKYLKENSIYFPKVIGAEKRSKKFTDFKVLKNLGQGAYGKVVFAQYKKDPLYKDCVKAIFKERILVDTWVRDRTLGTIPSEIQILYALNKFPHPNIMRIVDFFEDDNCYYLETLQHGSQGSGAMDLYDIIEMKKDMIEIEAKYIYFQVVAALTHMHHRGIVHRDIKDENIIVDKDYFAKLIDFGSAAWVKDGPFGVFVGTIDYAAPEVLNGQPYEGKAQDVWAMGVLLFTLVFKENPFCSVDEILDAEVKFPQYAETSVSPACVELIRKILVTDVNKRPTMKEIMDDPWLCGLS